MPVDKGVCLLVCDSCLFLEKVGHCYNREKSESAEYAHHDRLPRLKNVCGANAKYTVAVREVALLAESARSRRASGNTLGVLGKATYAPLGRGRCLRGPSCQDCEIIETLDACAVVVVLESVESRVARRAGGTLLRTFSATAAPRIARRADGTSLIGVRRGLGTVHDIPLRAVFRCRVVHFLSSKVVLISSIHADILARIIT